MGKEPRERVLQGPALITACRAAMAPHPVKEASKCLRTPFSVPTQESARCARDPAQQPPPVAHDQSSVRRAVREGRREDRHHLEGASAEPIHREHGHGALRAGHDRNFATLTVATQKHVDTNFTSAELTMSVQTSWRASVSRPCRCLRRPSMRTRRMRSSTFTTASARPAPRLQRRKCCSMRTPK